jgi:hypothetical protein
MAVLWVQFATQHHPAAVVGRDFPRVARTIRFLALAP